MKFRNNKTTPYYFVLALLMCGLDMQLHGAGRFLREPKDKDKKLLMAAVYAFHDVQRVKDALQEGADVNALVYGDRPLQAAAKAKNTLNVLELLRQGADPALKDGVEATGDDFFYYVGGPGFDACVTRGGDNLEAYEKYCDELEATTRDSLNAVLLPVAGLQALIITYLPHNRCAVLTQKLNNEMCKRIAKTDPQVVQSLLAQKADPDRYQRLDVPYLMTPLQIALMRGDFDAARILLAHKADPKQVVRSAEGWLGDTPFVQLLVGRQPWVSRPHISSLWRDCATQNPDGTVGEDFFLQGHDGIDVPEATDREKKRMQEIIDFMMQHVTAGGISQVDRAFVREYLKRQKAEKND